MSNSAWDCVPAGTPECTIMWDTPCCGCGDCHVTEKTFKISEKVEVRTSVYDNGAEMSCGFIFWDTKRKYMITEFDLFQRDLGLSYSEFKKVVNGLFMIFKPVEPYVGCVLDDFK